jgi:hypothetical protein
MSVCWAEDKATLPLPDPGNVTLTLDEYNKLVERAAKPPKKPDAAPPSYSIKHADLKLRVENNGVMGSVELEGEVFHKGISKVPLTSGMTILDAHQNGKGVPLIHENGAHVALLPGPGEFSIGLDTGLPLRIDAGRASFSLPAPVAGSVQMSLLIPGEHTLANINPGVITSRKSENGHTAIEATLVPGQPANIWWATREVSAPAAPREVRFLADSKTLVSVSEAEMRVAVLADITMLQGKPHRSAFRFLRASKSQVSLDRLWTRGDTASGRQRTASRHKWTGSSVCRSDGEQPRPAQSPVSDLYGALDQ